MIATEEWKREVIKHENIIKELEKKYEKKCKTLKVHMRFSFDYCDAIKCCCDSSLAYP